MQQQLQPQLQLDYGKLDGLVPAVIQDYATREVLMVGFMNEEAWRKTLETGFATFYSRTRNRLWMKGETSGHRLAVKDILVDCDNDSLVLLAEQSGPGTCHEGYRSCFFRRLVDGRAVIFQSRTIPPQEGA
jgi:phosphoribosyl-AMP cyclohydrolase